VSFKATDTTLQSSASESKRAVKRSATFCSGVFSDTQDASVKTTARNNTSFLISKIFYLSLTFGTPCEMPEFNEQTQEP
jgi:hypothetical protein